MVSGVNVVRWAKMVEVVKIQLMWGRLCRWPMVQRW